MSTLFAELRKRNVFRVAIAYCVIGWLIAQVADLAADNFDAPGWVMRMLLVVLLLGLPVALFLAWAFELTPAGVVRAEEVPAGAAKDPRSGRILNRIIIGTLVLAVAGLVWDRSRDAAIVVDAVIDKSIAVLPFADFSPGGDQGWFADGLTDEILNALARTNDLRVASRTSAFNYRGTDKDIPTIAGELGVAHILEGSVRRGDARVRVTAQLIRAADDTHLWSETFDGSNADAISIQENIALSIARALQTTMDPAELERMLAAGTNSVAAWELYLRALALLNDGSAGDATKSSDDRLAYLERAVALDPTFVDAHIGIAELWSWHRSETRMDKISTDISDAEAKLRFDRAIEAAAANARSESSRLEYQVLQAREDVRLSDALALVVSLVELRPNNSAAVFKLLYLQMMTGEYDAARATGLRLGALLRAAGQDQGLAYQMLHRLDVPAALEMVDYDLQPSRQRFADLYQAHRVLLYAGKTERAAGVAAQYVALSPTPDSLLMVQIRQACAEGRVADADALFAGASLLRNRWLYLKTLGRDEDALESLLEFDNPAGAHTLADYLAYTTFDPNDYPYVAGLLAAQGIRRPPAHTIPFACKR